MHVPSQDPVTMFAPLIEKRKELNPKSWRGAARAEDAEGTPTQSHIPPSILVYEEKVIRYLACAFLESGDDV